MPAHPLEFLDDLDDLELDPPADGPAVDFTLTNDPRTDLFRDPAGFVRHDACGTLIRPLPVQSTPEEIVRVQCDPCQTAAEYRRPYRGHRPKSQEGYRVVRCHTDQGGWH